MKGRGGWKRLTLFISKDAPRTAQKIPCPQLLFYIRRFAVQFAGAWIVHYMDDLCQTS